MSERIANKTVAEMWEALGECWTSDFGELELEVRHTLTEPTCPTAIIVTESTDGPSWRADCETIEEAIRVVTTAAYVTIIERKPKPLTFPAPRIDEDDRLARFLAALDLRAKLETI